MAAFLGLGLLASFACQGAVGAAMQPARETLVRLAASVASESDGAQADFAAVALVAVIRAYETEFERLSVPGQVSRRELARQSRWALSLERFLEELHAALEELDAGAPVRILVAPPAAVQLLVGERLVEVSSPRIAGPEDLDAEIVARFCESFPCDPQILESQLRSREPAALEGGWSFRAGMGSTFETPDGLGFMFADVHGRGVKEAVCRKLHAELMRLADALGVAQRRGRAIDFDVLTLESPGRGDNQRVVLSRDGARLRMDLPTLGRVPAVVEVAREWLRARAQGRPHRQLFPRSDLLLAGLLSGP